MEDGQFREGETEEEKWVRLKFRLPRLRKIVTKIETQLQSIDRKWAFGIPTWCRLPQAPHLRPAAGSPDTVDIDPDGEVSKVLQHFRRELGLPSRRFQYHIRFGLRASDVEKPNGVETSQ